MKTIIAVAFCVAVSATAATPPPPIDEAVVAALVKEGMSEPQVRASYNSCDSGGPISMKVCFRYRLERETLRLNGAYGELRESLLKQSESNVQKLEQAQAAWAKYQQLHCSSEGDVGSFNYGVEMLACQSELARQRADTLVEMLQRWNSVQR